MNTNHPKIMREGRVMRGIRIYLNKKALHSKSPADPSVYASLREISDALKERYDVVDDSLGILLRNGDIKLYPDGSKWRRLFGSKNLPEITRDDFMQEVKGILASRESC